MNFLFPEGVSAHVLNYIFSEVYNISECSIIKRSQMIEFIFEYVRKSYYPQRPSRFISFFAFDSIELAKNFRSEICNSQGNICEIESEESFGADMNLLRLEKLLLKADHLAHLYWKGETIGNPYWEYLLVPPVKVIRKVDDQTSK
jgi:hypothetical protein